LIACERIGISLRTVQRWEAGPETADARKGPRGKPANALSEAEKQRVLDVINRPEFADLSPRQIVPILAERGIYYCSESTVYRLLRERGQDAHRGKARPPRHSRPKALTATGPNQVWSWDITYLRTAVAGVFLYLYLVVDVYSRKIVGWTIHECESDDLAAEMMAGIVAIEQPTPGLTIHSDNGNPMKGATLKVTLERLGVLSSFSRPRVSNDNPFSEALFRTLKYRPEYPVRPFPDIDAARRWVAAFADWYNEVHRHSAIRFVTPGQRHRGEDVAILAARHAAYCTAKTRHPERWTGATRNWSLIGPVTLNPTPLLAPEPLPLCAAPP